MRAIPLFLAAGLLLAGCVGKEAPAMTPAEAGRVGAVEPEVMVDPLLPDGSGTGSVALGDAPLWNVGDAWSIMSMGNDATEQSYLVVVAADGDSYTLATTSESQAGYDAMFDISFIGKIRARDLAGHQQGEPVQFFDFPLADGKTWTTTWDGFEVTLTAKQTPKGFDIVGVRADGEPHVTYDYDPALRWWSKLEFPEGYGIKADRLVEGWTGAIVTGTAELVFDSAPAPALANPGSGSFTIAEGQSFGMVLVMGGGEAWARGFQLFEPAGTPYLDSTIGTFEFGDAMTAHSFRYQQPIPATPGEWHIVAPMMHDPSGWGSVLVYQVAVATKQFP